MEIRAWGFSSSTAIKLQKERRAHQQKFLAGFVEPLDEELPTEPLDIPTSLANADMMLEV